MLILEIALGIVLAYVILAFLPYVLLLAVWLLGLAMLAGVAFLIAANWPQWRHSDAVAVLGGMTLIASGGYAVVVLCHRIWTYFGGRRRPDP